MKQSTLSFFYTRRVCSSPPFVFAVAVLLCGIVAGSFTGMHIPQNNETYMNRLSEILTQDYAAHSISQNIATAACIAAWPAAVLIVGCGRGRELWTAIVVAARGFLFSFSVTAAIIKYGWSGVALSAAAAGIPAVVSLPALLLVTGTVLLAGQKAGRRSYWRELSQYTGCLFFSALLLLAAMVWRLVIAPHLIGLILWNL